jgi:hypothetical protein
VLVRDILPPYPAFSIDLRQAHGALDAFHARGFEYEHVLAGHGRPVQGRAREKVLAALERYRAANPRAADSGR